MSTEILGHEIDIHGGGLDLQFPHHENEIAQSCCAHPGSNFVRTWMHNGFINVDSEKMSKSLGNFHFLRDVLKKFPGEAVRLTLLGAQYRQPQEFNFGLLEEAKKTLDKFYRLVQSAESHLHRVIDASQPTPEFVEALADDLNTPAAMAEIYSLASKVSYETNWLKNPSDDGKRHHDVMTDKTALEFRLGEFKACCDLLGILQLTPEQWFKGDDKDNAYIDGLIAQRNEARAKKDFATADKVRAELTALNIIVDDAATGTTWRRG